MKNIQAIPFALALMTMTIPAFGQKYKTAAGVRFDNGLNLTVQQYISNGWTAEGILRTPVIGNKMGATVLAEKHHKIITRGTNFYVGGGAHYYWQTKASTEAPLYNPNVFGLSGIAGFEFTLGRINLAVDWKPELHLTGTEDNKFNWNGASISARYIIEKRKPATPKWKFWKKK